MKKFLFSLLLLPALVFAQESSNQGPVIVDKKVACDTVGVIVYWLTEHERQKPFWVGTTEGESFLAVITNEKTGTWTLIEFNDKYACVLSTGLKNILTLPLH